MKLQKIIDTVFNIINFIYNYIDKYVIKLLINIVREPMSLISDRFNFKNKLINNYYDTILSTIKYEDSKITVVNNKNEVINTLNNNSIKPSLILQNHLTPKNDILTAMYIMNNYLPNNSTFLGSIFSSFHYKLINDIFNKVIKSIVKQVSMIYIEWDLNENKPAKYQIERINKEAADLYASNCNLLIYPEGKPNNLSLELETFKSGYKHIIKETNYDNIIILSVIYTDMENKLLLKNKLVESKNYQTKVMVDTIEIEKSQVSDKYLEDLEVQAITKMKNNLQKLVECYVN